LGCGTGDPIAGWLIEQGYQVIGVDFASSLLAIEILKKDGSYYIEGLRGVLWSGLMLYREAMRRTLTFFGFGQNEDSVGTMDEMLRHVYPERFTEVS